MARLILPLIAIIVIWLLLRQFFRTRQRSRPSVSDRKYFKRTVQCYRCGVYLDKQLARQDEQGHYCRQHDQTS